MPQINRQEFDDLKRTVQQSVDGSAQAKIKELENRVKDLEMRLNLRSPLLQTPEDVARVEAIFDIIVKEDVATQQEISQYLDLYPQFWEAILQILIEKGITTEKRFYCHLLAYHHMFRVYGLTPARDKVDIFTERIKYADEMEKLLEPITMAGR